MKRFFAAIVVLVSSISVRAKLLPMPGFMNPDWKREQTENQKFRCLPTAPPPVTDRIPNATQRSIRRMGNRYVYWDADRQLAYEWLSGSESTGPEKQVTVIAQRTGTAYIYHRSAR